MGGQVLEGLVRGAAGAATGRAAAAAGPVGQAVDEGLRRGVGAVRNALLMPSAALTYAGVPAGPAAAIGLGGTAAAGLAAANLLVPNESRTQIARSSDQAPRAFTAPSAPSAGVALSAPSAPAATYGISRQDVARFDAEQVDAINAQARRRDRRAREQAEFEAASRPSSRPRDVRRA